MKKTTNETRDHRPYALGYSPSELRRLERQGAFFRDLTEDVLKRAGLKGGMRVLDLGCGVGDTSLVAARLVGPSGVVVGVDRSAEAVDVAQRCATTARRRHSVQFVVADLDTFVDHLVCDGVQILAVPGLAPWPGCRGERLCSAGKSALRRERGTANPRKHA
jgi:SAM-dependent methyltransferase